MHKVEGRGKRDGGGRGGDAKRKRGRKTEGEVKEVGKRLSENKKKTERGLSGKLPHSMIKIPMPKKPIPEVSGIQAVDSPNVKVEPNVENPVEQPTKDSETSLSDTPTSSDTHQNDSRPSSVTCSDEGRQSATSEEVDSNSVSATAAIKTDKKLIEPAALVASVKNELSEYYRLHDEYLKQLSVLTERSKKVYGMSEKNEKRSEQHETTVYELTDDFKLSSKPEQDNIDDHTVITTDTSAPCSNQKIPASTISSEIEPVKIDIVYDKNVCVPTKKEINGQLNNYAVLFNLTKTSQNVYVNQSKAAPLVTESLETIIPEKNTANYSVDNIKEKNNEELELVNKSISRNIVLNDNSVDTDYKEHRPELSNIEHLTSLNCKINEFKIYDNNLSNTEEYEDATYDLSGEENQKSGLETSFEMATQELKKEYDKLCSAATLLGKTSGDHIDISKTLKNISENCNQNRRSFNSNESIEDARQGKIVECLKTKLLHKVLEESLEQLNMNKTFDERDDCGKESSQEYERKSSEKTKNKNRSQSYKITGAPIDSDYSCLDPLEPLKVEIFKKPKLLETSRVVTIPEKSAKSKRAKKFSFTAQGKSRNISILEKSVNSESTSSDLEGSPLKKSSELKPRRTDNGGANRSKEVSSHYRGAAKGPGGDSVGGTLALYSESLLRSEKYIADSLRAQIEKVSMEEYLLEKAAVKIRDWSPVRSYQGPSEVYTAAVLKVQTAPASLPEEKKPPVKDKKSWSFRSLLPSKDMILDAIFSVLTGFVLYYLIDLNVRHFFLGESDNKNV